MISLFFFVSWLDFNSVDQFDCSYVYVWTFSTLAIPFEWLCEYVWISSFLLLMLSYTLDPFPLSCAKAHVNVHSPVTTFCKLLCYCPYLFTVMHAFSPLSILAYWCPCLCEPCMCTDSPLPPLIYLYQHVCIHFAAYILSMATYMKWSLLKPTNNTWSLWLCTTLYMPHTYMYALNPYMCEISKHVRLLMTLAWSHCSYYTMAFQWNPYELAYGVIWMVC